MAEPVGTGGRQAGRQAGGRCEYAKKKVARYGDHRGLHCRDERKSQPGVAPVSRPDPAGTGGGDGAEARYDDPLADS